MSAAQHAAPALVRGEAGAADVGEPGPVGQPGTAHTVGWGIEPSAAPGSGEKEGEKEGVQFRQIVLGTKLPAQYPHLPVQTVQLAVAKITAVR